MIDLKLYSESLIKCKCPCRNGIKYTAIYTIVDFFNNYGIAEARCDKCDGVIFVQKTKFEKS